MWEFWFKAHKHFEMRWVSTGELPDLVFLYFASLCWLMYSLHWQWCWEGTISTLLDHIWAWFTIKMYAMSQTLTSNLVQFPAKFEQKAWSMRYSLPNLGKKFEDQWDIIGLFKQGCVFCNKNWTGCMCISKVSFCMRFLHNILPNKLLFTSFPLLNSHNIIPFVPPPPMHFASQHLLNNPTMLDWEEGEMLRLAQPIYNTI
jgi:hypothetical protein